MMATIKLIHALEQWRESSIVQDTIDRTENAIGYHAESYGEYDCLIEDFRRNVGEAIRDAGHEVVWGSQQTVGLGAILQGPWVGPVTKMEHEAIFDAVISKCRDAFAGDCEAYCRAEMDIKVIIGEWGWGARSCGHIVCRKDDRDAVKAAYDAIEEGDLSSEVLDGVKAAGGWYVEEE
jgi:hypothetical protein